MSPFANPLDVATPDATGTRFVGSIPSTPIALLPCPPTAPDRTSTVLAAVFKPAGATESVEAGFAVAVIDDEDRAIERL